MRPCADLHNSDESTWLKSTLGYAAPEIFQHEFSNFLTPSKIEEYFYSATDIFSLGATVWDLLLCQNPVDYKSVGDSDVRDLDLPPLAALRKVVFSEGVKLVASMLDADPRKRSNAEECLKNAWFSEK